MKKLTTLAAIATLAFAFAAPPVFAQSAAPAAMMADHSLSTSKLIGDAVYNDQGDKIGSIIDILVKNNNAEPTAILSVGDYVGGGSKLVAVPLNQVNLAGAKAMMKGATRTHLVSMPSFVFPGAAGGAG